MFCHNQKITVCQSLINSVLNLWLLPCENYESYLNAISLLLSRTDYYLKLSFI